MAGRTEWMNLRVGGLMRVMRENGFGLNSWWRTHAGGRLSQAGTPLQPDSWYGLPRCSFVPVRYNCRSVVYCFSVSVASCGDILLPRLFPSDIGVTDEGRIYGDFGHSIQDIAKTCSSPSLTCHWQHPNAYIKLIQPFHKSTASPNNSKR